MLLPSVFQDRFFDDSFMDFPPLRAGKMENTLMKSDVKDAGDHFELKMDLPGFDKDDVKIKLNDGMLQIEATTSQEKEEGDKESAYLRRERFQGTCTRSFYVGEEVRPEDVKARFEKGVLEVDLPKEVKHPEIEEKKFIPIEG